MRFMSALALLFIALKLLSVITWSWWLVLLPLYAGILIVLGIIILSAIGFGAAAALSATFKR